MGKEGFMEKFVVEWTILLNNGGNQKDNTFWSDFFLLKVNFTYVSQSIASAPAANLNNIAKVVEKSMEFLENEHEQRRFHSLELLRSILRGLFQRKYSNFNAEILSYFCGFENSNVVFPKLVVLTWDKFDLSVSSVFLLELCVAIENINANSLVEYIIRKPNIKIFSLWHSFLQPAFELLCVLINYKKFECKNNYLQMIHDLDDEKFFDGLILSLSPKLSNDDDDANIGSYTSMVYDTVSSWIWGSNVNDGKNGRDGIMDVLPNAMLVYELIYLNQSFHQFLCSSVEKLAIVLKSVHHFQKTATNNSLLSLSIIILQCMLQSSLISACIHDSRHTIGKIFKASNLGSNNLPLNLYILEMVSFAIGQSVRPYLKEEYYRLLGHMVETLLHQFKNRVIRISFDWPLMVQRIASIMIHLQAHYPHAIPQYLRIMEWLLIFADGLCTDDQVYFGLLYSILRFEGILGGHLKVHDSSHSKYPNLFSFFTFFLPLIEAKRVSLHVKHLSTKQIFQLLKEHETKMQFDRKEKIEVHSYRYIENPGAVSIFRDLTRQVCLKIRKRQQLSSVS